MIVGLGNPGREYEGTRHNIGFEIVDKLATDNGINVNKGKFNALYGEGRIAGEKVFLVKPTTYMNNSGQAVRALADFYKIPVENIIVIFDDIDIPFGSIRIKSKGSGGTHNGMKSIVNHLSSKDFPRLKVGVGSKLEGQNLANFVLSKFSNDEKRTIEDSISNASKAIETIISKDLDMAMNEYNKIDRAQE